jgi:hypothetical protein
MRNACMKKSTVLLLIIVIIMALVLSLGSGCACPLFSLIERATVLNIRTGNNIDGGLVVDELIYPNSTILVQVSGDIDKIIGFVGDYGVNLSEDERASLEQLPQDIREQQINVTLYSTTDDKSQVMDFYQSLSVKGWEIEGMERPGQEPDAGMDASMIYAEKNERRQALLVSGMERNTFIMFVNFDWELLGLEED